MPSKKVSCPVCKRKLGEGESLHEHLNIHPKELVIEALVQLKRTCKSHSPSSSVPERSFSVNSNCSNGSHGSIPSGSLSDDLSNDSSSDILSTVDAASEDNESELPDEDLEDEFDNELKVKKDVEQAEERPVEGPASPPLPPPSPPPPPPPPPPLPPSENAIPPCAPSTPAGHIVQYPQFLTRAAPVAQFIQVPVVTSAVSNAVQPPAGQTPVVIYNQFVCPSAPTEPTNVPASEPARILQFITSNNLIRTPYSIIQTRPSSVVPPQGSTGHIIYMSASPVVQQSSETHDTARETTSGKWVVAESDGASQEPAEPCDTMHQTAHYSEESLGCSEIDVPEQGSSQREITTSLLQQSNQEAFEDSQQCEHNVSHETESNTAPNNAVQELRDSQEHELLSPSKKRKCTEWNSLGSPEPRSPGWSCLGSPGAQSTSSVEGSVRVRSDLNISHAVCASSPSGVRRKLGTWPIEVCLKEEVEQDYDSCADGDSCHSSTYNDDASNPTIPISNASSIAHESISSLPLKVIVHLKDTPVVSSLEEKKGLDERKDHASFNLNKVTTGGNCVSEGLRIIIPNVSSSLNDDFREDCSIDRPATPPCDSGPPSPYPKSLDSPSTPLNIQTDETMPPRGELSEQESIGGNSSSMWSVPVYHTSREWPSPVVSYDLTARESWPGSDVSDNEGSANASDSKPFKTSKPAPSFTNTLQPFISKDSSDVNFCGESPFSSLIQTVSTAQVQVASMDPSTKGVHGLGSSKSLIENNATSKIKKAPAKPRVYRCKECSAEFSSLKLRRQHPCDQMRQIKNSDGSITATQINMDPKGLTDVNVAVPGSSSEESSLLKSKKKCIRKPKATIKKEVIVEDLTSGQANFSEQYRISKLEPEDSAESRVNSQSLPGMQEPEPYQSPSFEFVKSAITYEDDPLKNEIPQAACGPFQCQKCDQVFKSACQLTRHMTIKHKGKKYQCTTCSESFEDDRSYHDHLMIHPLECQKCGKTFMRRKYLTLHMKRHMDVKPHKCETCSKSFVTKQKLDEHINTHTGNAPIKCADCDESFRRYSNLVQHRNRYHLNVKPKTKDYICHCGEVLSSKKKLEWHKEIHHDKPKSCHYCSEKFLHTVSLTRHVRRTHDRRYLPKKERESENIECPVCHLVFLKSSLATHMKIHSGERPYPCHICNKDFTTKWNLQLHRWTHASRSSRPFKCTQCKSAFVRKPDYLSHMHTHRNMRPFTCNHCGCQFVRKSNCLRHMREHEQGKSFACTVCNKTFHRAYYLKDHMRVHTGTRPFSCHICGKASTSKSNHNKHVRIHHAREPQNTEI